MSIAFNIITILNLLFIITVIFFERKNPISTLSWVIVLEFLPVVGFILYLLIGRGFSRKREFILTDDEKDGLKKVVKNQIEMLDNHKNEIIPKYKEIINMNLNTDKSICTFDNDVKIFISGEEKFESLINDIKNAKEYVHLEYFIIRNDETGRRLIDVLCEKAKEGLDVKFVYDAMGSFFTPWNIFKPLKEVGVKVYKFSPLRSFTTIRANYRNHRKIVVIDGKIGYIGGMNIGDEYRGLVKKLSPWRDTHLRITGSAVNMLEIRFILDYRYASQEKLYDISKYFQKENDIYDGDVPIQIVSSGPDGINENIKMAYARMINLAKDYVYIQTPYFVPDDTMIQALKMASYSGIDVKIMIPSITDNRIVSGACETYIPELLKCGIKFYSYEGMLHAKTMISDDNICSIGSANMDGRSFTFNFEANAFIYSEEITIEYKNIFNKDLEKCKEITLEDCENLSMIKRAFNSVCRLISPLA